VDSGENASALAADAFDVERDGDSLQEARLLPHLAAAAYARALGRQFRPHRSIDEPHAAAFAGAATAADARESAFGGGFFTAWKLLLQSRLLPGGYHGQRCACHLHVMWA
jgi:hypothetical protein